MAEDSTRDAMTGTQPTVSRDEQSPPTLCKQGRPEASGNDQTRTAPPSMTAVDERSPERFGAREVSKSVRPAPGGCSYH